MDAPPSTACTQRLHRDWTFLFLSAVKQVSTPQFLRLPLRSSRAAPRLERRGASESIPQSLGPAGWRPQAKSGEVNGFSWRTAWNDSVVEFFLEVNRFSWKLYNLGLFFSLFSFNKVVQLEEWEDWRGGGGRWVGIWIRICSFFRCQLF